MNTREIKFRAWLLKQKRWLDWGFSVDETEGIVYDSDLVEYKNGEDIILMQYTGLKDKSGKEIYEGDIIQAHQFEPKTYEVTFIEGGFCCSNPNVNMFPIDLNHFYPNTGVQAEVVGNIYENPELIKN